MKDVNGLEVKAGDFVAYSVIRHRSARLIIGIVLETTDKNFRMATFRPSLDVNQNPRTNTYTNSPLVITEFSFPRKEADALAKFYEQFVAKKPKTF